jgi:hypothetical protein
MRVRTERRARRVRQSDGNDAARLCGPDLLTVRQRGLGKLADRLCQRGSNLPSANMPEVDRAAGPVLSRWSTNVVIAPALRSPPLAHTGSLTNSGWVSLGLRASLGLSDAEYERWCESVRSGLELSMQRYFATTKA